MSNLRYAVLAIAAFEKSWAYTQWRKAIRLWSMWQRICTSCHLMESSSYPYGRETLQVSFNIRFHDEWCFNNIFNIIGAILVAQLSVKQPIWRTMLRYTVVKNHSNVKFVQLPLPIGLLWRGIEEFMKNTVCPEHLWIESRSGNTVLISNFQVKRHLVNQRSIQMSKWLFTKKKF